MAADLSPHPFLSLLDSCRITATNISQGTEQQTQHKVIQMSNAELCSKTYVASRPLVSQIYVYFTLRSGINHLANLRNISICIKHILNLSNQLIGFYVVLICISQENNRLFLHMVFIYGHGASVSLPNEQGSYLKIESSAALSIQFVEDELRSSSIATRSDCSTGTWLEEGGGCSEE